MIGAACQKGTMHDVAASGMVPHGYLFRTDASKFWLVFNDPALATDRLQAGGYRERQPARSVYAGNLKEQLPCPSGLDHEVERNGIVAESAA